MEITTNINLSDENYKQAMLNLMVETQANLHGLIGYLLSIHSPDEKQDMLKKIAEVSAKMRLEIWGNLIDLYHE